MTSAGRQRGIDREVDLLHPGLHVLYLHAPLVEQVFGTQALALLLHLNTASAIAEVRPSATIENFQRHPDATISTSRHSSAPVTRALGKSLTVTHRRIRN